MNDASSRALLPVLEPPRSLEPNADAERAVVPRGARVRRERVERLHVATGDPSDLRDEVREQKIERHVGKIVRALGRNVQRYGRGWRTAVHVVRQQRPAVVLVLTDTRRETEEEKLLACGQAPLLRANPVVGDADLF